MRIRIAFGYFMLLLLASCSSTLPRSSTVSPASRTYHGTASVGDFMTITVDSGAHTIYYNDFSNNTSGTVPYTENSDGTYTLNDPTGNLVGAYEVPNYALLIQAAKTGPDSDTPALITAVESGQISIATFEAQPYNTMQFRTAAGGLEVGTISVNAQGLGSISSYWPYGSYNQGNQSGSPFHTGTIDMSKAQLDPTGTFLKVPEPNNEPGFAYAFGTANGIFAVDTGNGALLGLKKAASKDFDSTMAGTYKALYYQKTGASTGAGNVETGTAKLGKATLVVTGLGQMTVTDAQGHHIVQATLVPVADTSDLYGSTGQLTDPCYGVFTFRVTTASSQQDVFVTFMDKAMLFASFSANLPFNNGGTYNYLYGVGLK
jgi:hypothetical protein